MRIEKARFEDLYAILQLQYLAYQSEADLFGTRDIPPLKQTIEYIPAEHAWNPIDAPGYMYIDCLWVSGSFKRLTLRPDC